MSEPLDYDIPFRGDLKAAVGVGSAVLFVTHHPEGRPAGLVWNDLGEERPKSQVFVLPGGGSALVADGDSVWVGGGDGQLYRGPVGDAPKPIGPKLPGPPKGLAILSDDRLGAIVGSELLILSRQDGRTKQSLPLPAVRSAIAADPAGKWVAVGSVDGSISVFEGEGAAEFVPSDSRKVHEAAVTALLFERDDLRFFSAGADQRLFTTHARGKLEPEDKGRGNTHADVVPSMIWGPADRLLTGGRDGAVKSWPRVGGVKPSTQKDGVAKVVAMALVTRLGREHLAVACEDNTVRTFSLDASGKIGDLVTRGHDALASARRELGGNDHRGREVALHRLAEYDDSAGLGLVAEQVGKDPDHALRVKAAELLGKSDNPQAATLLEPMLKHPEAAVRSAVLAGLRRQRGAADLRTLDLALRAEKPEIGKAAVEALAEIAPKDDRALARLTAALSARTPETRQAALIGLESAYAKDSPEADLIALGTEFADVRQAALLRLFRRGFLEDPAVRTALRLRAEDADAEVRRVAFLLALHARPSLLASLRARDPELERQVADLEGTAEPAKAPKKATTKEAALASDDLEPLLQASASRSLDTSLRGARGLAVLGDPRAFGLLLQLSREDEATARVEVCRAMAALDDPRAVERLRSLLADADAAVRDAAFSALARLHQADPWKAAEAGLTAPSEDVRRRGLGVLIASARKAPPKGPDDRAWNLLADALNDAFASIHSEAFKAVLNLGIGGGGPASLRFAMKSLRAEVRSEALKEAEALVGQPGGWDVLLEFFNDPDSALRGRAFEFATKKTKGLEILDAALGSRYPEMRKAAVEGLVKKHTAAAQKLLVRALEDEARAVRLAALESLVAEDAVPVLLEALDGPHADVRLRAAKALARHGRAEALAPLLSLVTTPEPLENERKKDWLGLAESALDGLGELGDPAAVPALIPLIDSPHPALRWRATQALAWSCPPGATAPLRDALRHQDVQVRSASAVGLAYSGDPSAVPLMLSKEAAKSLSAGEILGAALALSESASGEGHLLATLDDSGVKARDRALRMLVILEWKAPRAMAGRLLAALAARDARTRLVAAEALEALAEPAGLAPFVGRLINEADRKTPWKIAAATLDDLGELLAHADPRLRAGPPGSSATSTPTSRPSSTRSGPSTRPGSRRKSRRSEPPRRPASRRRTGRRPRASATWRSAPMWAWSGSTEDGRTTRRRPWPSGSRP